MNSKERRERIGRMKREFAETNSEERRAELIRESNARIERDLKAVCWWALGIVAFIATVGGFAGWSLTW